MKHLFSPEQIELLKQNPYTSRVNERQISFTKEFKELFYKKRQEGMSINDTLLFLGYDPDILGYKRIEGISYNINKSMRKDGCFFEGRRPKNSILDENNPEMTKENFLRMQHELQYLRQEMDFIKKISSLKDSGK